jgi:hypothetical protein
VSIAAKVAEIVSTFKSSGRIVGASLAGCAQQKPCVTKASPDRSR